jgi:hypothetical protein
MNLSQHPKCSLFEPFSASSWPTYYSNMSREVAFKAAKKIIKNQTFRILG